MTQLKSIEKKILFTPPFLQLLEKPDMPYSESLITQESVQSQLSYKRCVAAVRITIKPQK